MVDTGTKFGLFFFLIFFCVKRRGERESRKKSQIMSLVLVHSLESTLCQALH